MTLRVAVFGLGAMGRLHAAKIPLIPGAELVCVVDPDSAARAWDGVPAGVARYPSLDEAKGFDAAIIATPAATHHLLTSLLLARAIHCLVEKPVCPTAADAAKLVSQAQRYHLVLASGHLERINPALIEARRRAGRFMYIEAERIGPFPDRSTDADVIQDLMIHDLDAISAFDPGAPVDIRAVGIPVLTDKIDIANARIEFEGGQVASLTASRVSLERRRTFRVFSKSGYFSADLAAKTVKVVTVGGEGADRQIAGETFEAGASDQILDEDTSFVEACRSGAPPLTHAALSIPALELADRIRAVIKQP